MNQIEMDVARSQIRANKAIASLAEVNWEQRRYEIAKEVMPALMSAYFQKGGTYLDEGLTDFERTLADICIGWIGEEHGWKQYIKDNADALLKIAIEKFNSVQDVPFEQTPVWSKEDEHTLQGVIDEIQANKSQAPDFDLETYDRFLSWLKSLKNRYGKMSRSK